MLVSHLQGLSRSSNGPRTTGEGAGLEARSSSSHRLSKGEVEWNGLSILGGANPLSPTGTPHDKKRLAFVIRLAVTFHRTGGVAQLLELFKRRCIATLSKEILSCQISSDPIRIAAVHERPLRTARTSCGGAFRMLVAFKHWHSVKSPLDLKPLF